MDDGFLRQILTEHRQELGSLFEHWVCRQELAVARAVNGATARAGLPLDGAPLDFVACAPPIELWCHPEISTTPLSRRRGLVTAEPGNLADASFLGFRDLDPSAKQGAAKLPNVSDLGIHTDSLKAYRPQQGPSMRALVPQTKVLRSSWWKRRARRADHDMEEAVESQCPKLDCLGQIVNHVAFEFLISSTLLLNVAVIGIRTNQEALAAGGDRDSAGFAGVREVPWEEIESAFVVAYLAELVIRLLAFRVKFFTSEDRNWNMFDMLLVATSVPELVEGSTNYSYVRTWRVLKMMKILRIVRIARGLHELRLVLSSILGSVKALLWSMIVIAGTTYMLSIAFVHSTTDYILYGGHGLAPSELQAHDYFGSIVGGMLTLFASVTGGMDWILLGDALQELGDMYLLLFYTYICFFNFVLLNTVTSLFLDGVMHHTEQDRSAFVHDMLRRKKNLMASLKDLHYHMCDNGETEATLEGFHRHMNEPEMLTFARALEVDIVDLQVVFDVLSSGGRQSVDLESFVVGCIRLRGGAKSVDLISLSISQKKLAAACEDQFAELRKWVMVVNTALYAGPFGDIVSV